jgi:translation initiation factor IF-1
MATEEIFSLKRQIDEVLPDSRFRLRNAASIIAYTDGRMRRGRIRSVGGNRGASFTASGP